MSGHPMQSHQPPAGPILLIEDDPLSLKLMVDALEARGLVVERCTSGADAPAAADRARPALVVVDIGLPGLDGSEVTRHIKTNPATMMIPVIAVTAYAMQRDEQRMRQAGCDAFMAKPIRLAEFVRMVEALLLRRSGPAD